MVLLYGVVALNEPLPVAMNMRPNGALTESITSAEKTCAGHPDARAGTARSRAVNGALRERAGVYKRESSHAKGRCRRANRSRCRHAVKRSRPGRLFSHLGSQVRTEFRLPLPVPETEPESATGPPNFSAPVVMSSA